VTRSRTTHFVHEDGTRLRGRTGSGREIVFGDRAQANELSPIETVASALAACSAMDVIAISNKKRQAIERYEIDVAAEQRDDYPQVLTDVTVTHEVWGRDLSEAAIRRAIELSATKYCPVNAMVSAGATVVHHRYRISSDGDAPYEAEGEVVATGPYRRPEVVA
jgi:putative redox protein